MDPLTTSAAPVLFRQPLRCTYVGGTDLLGVRVEEETTTVELTKEPVIGDSTVVALLRNGLQSIVLYRCKFQFAEPTTDVAVAFIELPWPFTASGRSSTSRQPLSRLFAHADPDRDDELSIGDAAVDVRQLPKAEAPSNVVPFRFGRR
jgi:hypothetical protein